MSAIALRCPETPAHGRLLDAPGERWGWYCPHQEHDGRKGEPPTRAFFTTPEAETGAVVPVARSVPEPAAPPGAVQGRITRSEQPTTT